MSRRPAGTIAFRPPDHIHTPGVYVQHVVVGPHEKRIERRTVRANNLV